MREECWDYEPDGKHASGYLSQTLDFHDLQRAPRRSRGFVERLWRGISQVIAWCLATVHECFFLVVGGCNGAPPPPYCRLVPLLGAQAPRTARSEIPHVCTLCTSVVALPCFTSASCSSRVVTGSAGANNDQLGVCFQIASIAC